MNPHATIQHHSTRVRLALLAALTILLTSLSWSDGAAADEPLDVHTLLVDVQNGNADDRADAAKKLRSHGPPPAIAVGPLIHAAEIETDIDALREMLITLGESGMTEALGLIQTHARSPVEDVRKAGRRALKAWMVANRVMSAEQDLPDPPHPFYDAPPRMPPDRPAGHALTVWQAMPPGGLPDGPTEPAPYYQPPAPDGLPYGYHVTQKPRVGLAVAGGLVFAGLYAVPLIFAAASNSDSEALGTMAIPVAGPMILSAKLFEADGDFSGLAHLGGVLLVLDGVGQLAGLSMLVAGLAATEKTLERDGPTPLREAATPELLVSPTGMGLRWQF